MLFKKIIPLIIAACLFGSCSYFSTDDSDDDIPAVVIPTAVAGTSSNAASLRIKFDGDDARSALPQVDENSFIYIGLRCHFDENNSKMIAEWNSAAEMRNSTITFQTGRYTFDLIAMNTSVTMFDSQTAEIRNGENSLSFTPKLELIDYSFSGKGSLNVKVSFDATNVATVTAGLYYLDGEQCPGYNDVQREIEGGGVCTYSGSEIPAGNYIAIFKFYADEGMTQLLGTYREYASIAGGMTSSSVCQITSLSALYKIEYDLGGGVFVEGYTVPGSYTRRTSAITLPKNDNEETPNAIKRQGYQFGGWYDNPSFTGEAITEIPSGSTGDRKFYAKWLEEVTITFDLAGKGSMNEDKKFLKTLKGVPVLIPPHTKLGIVNPSDSFFHGWSKVSKNSGQQTVDYDNWDEITVNENTVLYAVWAVTEINPSENDPHDNKDSDGDGLTDWEEVFKFQTDPSCADTDGDGWTDKEETSLYNSETKIFSPLIADTPDLKIVIAGDPSISYKYSLGKSGNTTENESISNGTTGSSSSSKSSTTSYSMTNQWKEEVGFSYIWGNKGGFEIRANETFGQGFTNGDSYTYSSSQSEGWSKSWSNGKSKSETHSKTLSAATIKVPIKLKNPSPISYSVKSVSISISRLAHNGTTLLPLVTIQKTDVGTLAPNSESIVYTIEAELPNTDVGKQLENLLKYSNGLKVEIAGYSITMFKSGVPGQNDFTQALTKVRAKTASVYIDWGRDSGRTPKQYNISVKNLYNHDATSLETLYKDVTLKDIFDKILKLPENSPSGYELTNTGYIKSIYGVTNQSPLKNGAWYIIRKTIESEKKMMYLFSPENDRYEKLADIKVNPGDAISIIYDVDMDGDGLLLNEELLHGTSDNKTDSDGDGLNDFEEIYGWYKTGVMEIEKPLDNKYSTSNKVFTNPCLKDTDGDGDVDYTGAGGTQDTDPMIAKYNTNTALKSGKYSVDGGNNYKSFNVKDTNKSPFDNSVDCHSLRLDIEPELPIAHLQVQVTDLTAALDSNKWIDLKKDTDIGILMGKSIINVRCRVPSGPNTFAEEIHKYIVQSNFTTLKNFQVVPKVDGETAITWDKYVDIRAEGSNSGYFLQVINTDKASVEEPAYADAVNAQTTSGTKLTKFFMKLSPETMLKGTCVLNLSARSNYLVRLYAFAGDFTPPLGENSHASIKMLAQKKFLSGKSRTAKLAFWAHYIYDNHDHDGDFVDSNYYWSFDCSEKYIDFSKLDLSADKTQDMDEDDDQYWVFGNVNGPRDKKYGAQPFGNTSTKLEGSFSRDSNYKFTVRFSGYERDTSYSDHLGTIRADFEYKKNEDRWYCTWWLDSYGDDSACLGFLPKSSQVGCGERVDKNWWELYNVNKGEIAFAWGWDWDYN